MAPSRSVLVIGGTRFFGRGIVAELLRRGHAVTVLTRGNRPRPAGAAVLTADRTDEAALAEAVAGRTFDAVIDNVCYRPVDARTAVRIFSGRCRRYVMTSSVMSYLGHGLGGRPISEEAWFAPPSTVGMEEYYTPSEIAYGIAKRDCERIFLAETTLNVLVFRLHNVVGSDDFSGKSGVIPKSIANNRAVALAGRPEDLFQQVLADDLPALYAEAVERESGLASAYNVAAAPMTVAEYVQHVATALGGGARVELVPPGSPGALAPFPRNVLLDASLLARDFSVRLTDCPDFLPALARWYAAEAQA